MLRSVAVLVVLGMLVTGANLLWTAHEVRSFRSSQQQQNAAQLRQGALVEQKLCTTLGTPRRAEAASRAAVAESQPGVRAGACTPRSSQLGPDIGCKG